jgi:glc operon protein GlcG
MSPVVSIGTPDAHSIKVILAAAIARAEDMGVKVNIAIVDGAGNLAGFVRMPGSFLSSIELAIDKAYTAASFSMPTRGFSDLLENAPRAVRDGLLRRPRLTEVPGGFPIAIDDQSVGAIGVSGGSEEEDEEIASYALAEFAGHTATGRV